MATHNILRTVCLYVFFGHFQALNSISPSSDSILFSLDWAGPGRSEEDGMQLLNQANADGTYSMYMITKNKEKYKCVLPSDMASLNQENIIEDYKGPTVQQLIGPLFEQTMCSYRLESYWTYELCHGKSLRQFHEDKELGKRSKVQQYNLGTYNEDENIKRRSTQQDLKKLPTLKLEGTELPYYETFLGNGTKCDLTGTPRMAVVRYVCHPGGKGEIYEFKETSTCEYALIVLTNELCPHPAYQSKKEHVNKIKCHALDGHPRTPLGMDSLLAATSSQQYNNRREAEVVHIEEPPAVPKVETPISSATDKQTLKAFLSGDHCVHGGSTHAWWKHEFCFGKKVIQYHEDRNGRTDVILGLWDEESHIKWVQKNPQKAPKPNHMRRNLIFYYGLGDVCDLTGKRRFTEVKLKCAESSTQPHAISIYLLEPNPCEYLLVVESNLFCDLVKEADDHTGLIQQGTP